MVDLLILLETFGLQNSIFAYLNQTDLNRLRSTCHKLRENPKINNLLRECFTFLNKRAHIIYVSGKLFDCTKHIKLGTFYINKLKCRDMFSKVPFNDIDSISENEMSSSQTMYLLDFANQYAPILELDIRKWDVLHFNNDQQLIYDGKKWVRNRKYTPQNASLLEYPPQYWKNTYEDNKTSFNPYELINKKIQSPT